MNPLPLFEYHPRLTGAVSVICTHSFSAGFQPQCNQQLPHSLKNDGGIPSESEPKAKLSNPELLHHEERAKGERIDAGAVEAADRFARIGDQRLAEEIEARIHQNRSRRGFAEFVQQPPEAWIRLLLDGVHAHFATVERELLQALDVRFQLCQRGPLRLSRRASSSRGESGRRLSSGVGASTRGVRSPSHLIR